MADAPLVFEFTIGDPHTLSGYVTSEYTVTDTISSASLRAEKYLKETYPDADYFIAKVERHGVAVVG